MKTGWIVQPPALPVLTQWLGLQHHEAKFKTHPCHSLCWSRNRSQRKTKKLKTKKEKKTSKKEKKWGWWCYLLNLDALLFPQGYWQQRCFPETSRLLPVVCHWWSLNLQYPLAVCQRPAGSDQGFPLCLHPHCCCIPRHREVWAEQQEWKQGWREHAQQLLPGLQRCIWTMDRHLQENSQTTS